MQIKEKFFFYYSKINNSLLRMLMYITSKLLLHRIRTKLNFILRASLKYIDENFLYSSCRPSVYFAESNNTRYDRDDLDMTDKH